MAQSTSHLPLLAEDTIENNEATLTAIAHAVAAAKQGKLPSTEQGIALIQKLLKSNILQPSLGSRFAGKVGGGKLSPKGKELVENARGVLEALARVALEKNHDDKVRNELLCIDRSSRAHSLYSLCRSKTSSGPSPRPTSTSTATSVRWTT